jgi:cytochrome c biogenesis factor
MNLEMIVTTVLAMLTSLIPFFYKKMTDNTNLNMTSPYLFSAALILGINTACLIYSLLTYGFLETLFLIIVYLIIVGSIFLTQYLIKLNSK